MIHKSYLVEDNIDAIQNKLVLIYGENIGLINEMKLVADAMKVDIFEVVEAAATKPFGFTKYLPGPGLGGHCIPIDPFYLTWKAKEFGVHTQ